jgi:uncharacterized repeat protein (TIGR02543 family)
VVTAVALGTATITATTAEGGFAATCEVTVTPIAPTAVSLNKTETSLPAGRTETLMATVLPANAANKSVSWSSSNTAVATVDNNGEITAIAPGTAIITATTVVGGFAASCEVTVEPVSVTGVGLNKTATSLYAGRTETLTATVQPADATNKSVSWSSTNTEVAQVDDNGEVIAVAPGTATITATTVVGEFMASCEVTVLPVSVTGIGMDPISTSILAGGTETLTATVQPADATNKTVTWSSTNESVATVSSAGVVTAIAPGVATIIATAEGGLKAYCSVTVVPVGVTEVGLNKTETSLLVGGTETLTATILPADATNKAVVWSSTNTAVATVDDNGVVTAVAGGTATITATTDDGGFAASCNVTVLNFTGAGTQASPYIITTAAQLATLAAGVNGGDSALAVAYYKLGANIDLAAYGESYNDGKGWTPIGNSAYRFSGNFDGNNKTISNLYINTTEYYTGLFGYTSSVKVSNLGLLNVNIKGGYYTGSIFGYSRYTVAGNVSSITNCYAEGVVRGSGDVGGLAGYMYGEVTTEPKTPSIITKSYFIGLVNGTSTDVGGIVGYGSEINVHYCYAQGSVISASSSVGGVVGRNYYANITSCYSTSTVSGGNYVGGIVGESTGNSTSDGSGMYNCAALNPSVKGTGTYVGRVAGYKSPNFVISNNVAYVGLQNNTGNTSWAAQGTTAIDGLSIDVANITYDIGARFTAGYGFTVAANQLPGFGKTYPWPSYAAILTANNEIATFKAKIETSGFATTNVSTVAAARQHAETTIAAWNTYGITVTVQSVEFKPQSGDTAGFYRFTVQLSKQGVAQLTREVAFLVGSNLSITGMGDVASPYIISSAQDLVWLADMTNAYKYGFSYASYKLGANIDLAAYGKTYNDGKGWTPIANFYGSFDGDGHTISNLYIYDTISSYVGFFGNVSGGSVKNLGITNAEVIGDYTGDVTYYYVGGLAAAISSATVSKCYFSGSVSGSGTYTAGLVGTAGSGTVTDCYTVGVVQSIGQYAVGLLGGNYQSTVTVSYCYSVSSVYNMGSSYNNYAYGLTTCGKVTNSAALNPVVKSSNESYTYRVGGNTRSNNVGLTEMLGKATWNSNANDADGVNISLADITANGTIGNRFTTGRGWIIENGKLPSLFGEEVLIEPIVANQDVEKAKVLIEATAFGDETVLTASTQQAANLRIQSQIDRLALNGVTAIVTDLEFTAANAANGTNGSYTFAVQLTKEHALQQTTKKDTIDIHIVKFAQGEGTKQNPYLIRTPDELKLLATTTRSGAATTGAYYKQAANIDLQNKPWASISPFNGSYDGNGFYIDSLTAPLFDTVRNATLNCIGVNSGTIAGQAAIAVILTDTGYVTGCWNKAEVMSATRATYANNDPILIVGSIIGYVDSRAGVWTISECWNAGAITRSYQASFNATVGGIVGQVISSTILRDCYNTGKIYSNSYGYSSTGVYIGGIAGYAYGVNTPITSCYNTGSVSSYNNSVGYSGFIVGYYGNGKAAPNCFYDGTKLTSLPYSYSSSYSANGTSRTTAEFTAPNRTVVDLLNGTPSSYVWTQDAAENNGYPVINYGTVNISFNTKGGQPIADSTFLQKDRFELLRAPVREGYAFEGWYLDENYAAKAMPMAGFGDVDRTVYARWKTQTVFMTEKNSVVVAPKEFFADSAYLCSVNTGLPMSSRSGYTFFGWIDRNRNIVDDNTPATSAHDTLWAVWQVNIKFNTMGGEPQEQISYFSGVAFEDDPNAGLPIPTKEGYVFGSWYGEPRYDDVRTNSSIVPLDRLDTLYAGWGGPITVMFDPQNGEDPTYKEYFPSRTYSTSFNADGTVYNTGFPSQPTKEGAKFDGWYSDPISPMAGYFTAASTVDENIGVLYARWTEMQTITFETNGGNETYEPRSYFAYSYYSYTSGEIRNPGLPGNPTRADGAAFLGWYDTWDFSSYYPITNSSTVSPTVTTLYARWSEKITVQFETFGGTLSFTEKEFNTGFTYGSSENGNFSFTVTQNMPTRGTDRFRGWYIDYECTIPASNSNEVDLNTPVFYAKWSTPVTITFEVNGGIPIAPKEGLYWDFPYYISPNNYSLPTPSKTDAIFAGWYDTPDFSGSKIDNYSTVDQYKTILYAKWSEKITVAFDANNGEPITQKDGLYFDYAYYSSQNNYYSLPTPTKDGAIFMGWYDTPDFSGYQVTNSSLVDLDKAILFAKWSEKITVAFDANNGEPITQKEGLYFDYAYYSSQNSYYNLPTPTKDGAKFMGWYDNPEFSGSQITSSSNVDKNTPILFAKWIEKITINFELNGGTGNATPQNYFPEFNFSNSGQGNMGLPTTPTKDSAKFVGWYATPDFSGSIITNSTYVDNSMSTLYARWAEKVNVVFMDYSQEKVQTRAFWHSLEYYYTSIGNNGLVSASSPLSPNVTWYHEIVGLQDEMTDATPVPSRHTTLFARWCITVHFEVNEGDEIADGIYTPNMRYKEESNQGLPIAVRSGYGFEGWYIDAELTREVTDNHLVADSSYTLYAKWKAPTIVTVTFNTNSETTLGNKEYQADGLMYGQIPNTGLPTPTRSGRFAFDGWYRNNEFTQKVADTSIVQSVDHILYAKWNVIPLPKYTVTITTAVNGAISVKNGTTAVASRAQIDSNTVLTLLATPNTGYTFVEWWDNNTESNRSITLNADTTISATFDAIAVESVTLKPATALVIGGKETLIPTVIPSNALNKSVTWSSSKPSVATVSSAGLVTAIAAGTANIIVKTEDGNKTDTCTVTVSAASVVVVSVSLDKVTATLTEGQTEQLTATINPSNATNQNVMWSSNAQSIATVSNTGMITAVAKGTAIITVKTEDGNKTATCTVTVNAATIIPPVTPKYTVFFASTFNGGGISVHNGLEELVSGAQVDSGTVLTLQATPYEGYTFSKWWDNNTTAERSYTLKSDIMISATFNPIAVTGVTMKTATALVIGGKETLVPIVNPSNALNKSVTWESSNPDVATVNSSGMVTAISEGTAIITVTTTDGNKTATCTVTVSATAIAVTSVSLNKTSATLTEGETEQLTPTINPSGATNQNVTWSSSKPSVATVSSAGLITAVAEGTAIITVKTVDGEKTATCTVTVNAATIAVASVRLNKTAATLTIGGSEQLSATINPSNATNQNVTWSSSKTNVATVSNAGLVTAISAGTATITVTTTDGNKTATCTVTVSATAISVTSVSLNKTSATLTEGETEQLTPTINPSNATNQNVTWSSSKTNVATVSNAGLVTAISAGTAQIIVKTDDGNKTDTCTITVNAGTSVMPDIEQEQTLKIYPNPVIDGELNVENETWKAGEVIEVYSFSGARVAVYHTTGKQTTLDVSMLPTGTYVLRVGAFVERFVKR